MNRQEVLGQLPIGKEDFVLEIGAGHIPFHHTKLIIDKYPFDNAERWTDIRRIAPVLKADAIKLPLADNSVDLLFASHVLEHIDEPERFISEAKRCSKLIYLEFPSLKRELMYAWSFHKWLIEVSGTTLIFFKDDMPQLFNDFFHCNYDSLLDTWSTYRFEKLNNYIFTETKRISLQFSEKTAFQHALERSAIGDERINFAAIQRKDYSLRELLKLSLSSVAPTWMIEGKNALMRRVNQYKSPELNQEILKRLICQRCKRQELEFAEEDIECRSCHTHYEQSEGVFDFDI